MSDNPWRRRLLLVLLAAGLSLALSQVLPTLPTKTTLVFPVRGDAPVRKLSASWTPEGENEPAGVVTLNFPEPPSRISHALSTPPGRYFLQVAVERGDANAPRETSFVRRVTLDGSETVIPLDESAE